jgi:hypothetical protein
VRCRQLPQLGEALQAATGIIIMSAIANAATYDSWFKVADQDQDGRVTGPDAVA